VTIKGPTPIFSDDGANSISGYWKYKKGTSGSEWEPANRNKPRFNSYINSHISIFSNFTVSKTSMRKFKIV
jgi:hypothetical protein